MQNIVLAFIVACICFLTYELVALKEQGKKEAGVVINQNIKTDNKLSNKAHTNNASIGTLDKKEDNRKSLLSLEK